jgi:ribulose-5-phosphate 4-epimerase/fuculose-1-phosphate aldolase
LKAAKSELRIQIAQAVRILHGLGLLEAWGHVSGRVNNTSFYVLGHLHRDERLLSTTMPSDMAKVDLEGKRLKGNAEPPGEVYINTEIYKKGSDIQAIVHHH